MTVPRIVAVEPKPNMLLSVTFDEGTVKELDIKPYLERFEPFRRLKNEKLFQCVHVDCGGFAVAWNDDIDLDRYDIWEFGIPVKEVPNA